MIAFGTSVIDKIQVFSATEKMLFLLAHQHHDDGKLQLVFRFKGTDQVKTPVIIVARFVGQMCVYYHQHIGTKQ